jgi:hypothetical protein
MDEMNPTCREIEGLLSAYLDRELDPLVARRVEEHLVSCVACSDALIAMREAGRVLAAAVPLRSEAEWEALALRVEMAIDREEARVFQEAAVQDVMVDAAEPDFAMARAASMEAKARRREMPPPRRTRGFGWWAYGSGAIAAAMLVLLLWPWFKEHVEEGPPAPRAKAPQLQVGRDEDVGRDERANSPAPEQEQLTAREPAAPAPATKTEVDALRSSEGALRNEASPKMESGAGKQFAADQNAAQSPVVPSPAAPSPAMRQDFSGTKEKDARRGAPSETPAAAEEPEHLEESADGGSVQSAQEAAPPSEQKVAPSETQGAKKKVRATAPQPMSKNEVSKSWGETKSFRTMSKSMSEPSASDTPPPPTVKHFSETEWVEMSELQTQEALKAGTEKSLAEATHVLESFLKEYPRSAFRPEVSANLLRTTSALVQLNPNLWCESAAAALEGWKLEKPPPAINVDAEIATIEGRCLK